MTRIFYSTAKNSTLRELKVERSGAWIHLESPQNTELEALAKTHGLDIDLLLDGIDPNESPRIEREGTNTYIFTRYCLPEDEQLTTAPMLIIYTDEVVITVCTKPFDGISHLLSPDAEVYTSKRAQLVLQLLSEVNSGFKRRINQVSKRIWQIRTQLNKSQIDNKDFVSFIDIEEDLSDFVLVLEPMSAVLHNLLNGRFMRLYEEDKDLIEDLSLGTGELSQLASSRLASIKNIREAYSTITANNLNKVFKLMTSVTILLSIFTLVTGFYSMNIQLPFSENDKAFWVILISTLSVIVLVGYLFRRKRWL